ncbi:MAG: hypothetical protein AB1330_02530 [Bacillota bacterium]
MLRRGFRAKVGLLALALVWSLAGIGAASGAWREELTLSQTVTTGNVDVAFTDVRVVREQGAGSTAVSILPGGKAFAIEMNDVWHGSRAEIAYTVLNQGTIPVVAEPVGLGAEGIEMAVEPPPMLEAGAEGQGTVEVAVTRGLERGAAFETGGVVLDFRQWNR